MYKLYTYDHCPFCIRARMIFGLKDLDYEEIILHNADEETPISMIGQKMVPILDDNGKIMAESLDIVRYIDEKEGENPILSEESDPKIQEFLDGSRALAFKLVMPRFVKVNLKEFERPEDISYFKNKKEQMIGNFEENMNNTQTLIEQLEVQLLELENLFQSESSVHEMLSYDDIIVFPFLRNLTIVKGLQLPETLRAYVDDMSKKTRINLYDDVAL